MLFTAVKFARLESFDIAENNFLELLSKFKSTEPSPHAKESRGWVSPYSADSEEMAVVDDGSYQIKLQILTRNVPKESINKVLEERLKRHYEEFPDSKLSKGEQKEMREEVEYNLRPDFEPTESSVSLILDKKNGLIYANKNTDAVWGKATDLLKTMMPEEFSFKYFVLDKDICGTMSDWISDWDIPAGFSVGNHLSILNSDKAKMRTDNNDNLADDKIVSFIREGYVVQTLNLIHNNRVSFILNKNQSLTSMHFLDFYIKKIDEVQGEKITDDEVQANIQEINTHHIVMRAAFADLIPKITEILND